LRALHAFPSRRSSDLSLSWYAKAMALLDPLVQQQPRLLKGRLFLRNAHWGRAQALGNLGQYQDAVNDWDRAVALNAVPSQQLTIDRKSTRLNSSHDQS